MTAPNGSPTPDAGRAASPSVFVETPGRTGSPSYARRLPVAAAVVLTLATFRIAAAQEPPQPADGPVGLQGILTEEVPRELDFEAFAVLGGHWEQWAEDTTTEVARLYTEINELDLAAQEELLASLGRRLRQMEIAVADHRYRSIYDPLITLEGNLRRRLDLMRAALDTLALDAGAVAARRREAARHRVLSAVAGARSWLRGYQNGDTWIRYFRLDGLQAAVRDPAAPPEATQIVLEADERLQDLGRLDPEQRRFLQQPPIDRLREAVAEYARIVRAYEEPADEQALRDALGRLFEAVERYEDDPTRRASEAVRAAHRDLRAILPDGGERIAAALRQHYFNYNLKVVASEPFIGRLMHEQRVEASPVRDFIMGAHVYGQQVTWTTTGVNLKPNLDDAKFDLLVRGTVRSNTAGVTRQATVHTIGNHHFQASKEVRFNGYHFTSGPARVAVDANNYTAGINVRHGRVPILGGIIRGIASREVERRRPQAEAIARSRIAERVVPEMDREVARALADAERDIQDDLYVRLARTGLYPQATSLKTTSDYMWMNYRVWEAGELAGGTLSHTRNRPGGVTLHMHESYLNNLADRLDFNGRTMNESEIRRELEAYFSTLLGRAVDFESDQPPDPDEGPDTFVFADRDAVRVSIGTGHVNLIIRAAFRQQGREDIPQQIVTVPLRYRIDGDDIVTERGTVIVAPAAEPPSAAEQIARAGVIRRRIEASIPEQRRSRTISFRRTNQQDFAVRIDLVQPLNGWVTVWGQ